MFDDVQAIEGGTKVDAVEDQLCYVAVVDTCRFEYHGALKSSQTRQNQGSDRK